MSNYTEITPDMFWETVRVKRAWWQFWLPKELKIQREWEVKIDLSSSAPIEPTQEEGTV